ncbi:MarR family transcriptional regulator [Bacillus sporothermodurans]|uniref:MarR family transcriptional regulator n=1 Tax=Heyndrickxia sporothermodurans TaxID=46224 RepID=A0AB37HR43_9BACI|nr:MarR family transcriptional regulator [Heyndrickxia sporothermodurans]MBL5772145.1 MarR family transcriptional regulator [Heyndrickxia sporothermodurans]MBL5775696.1 MarR family transcriptional regulator [Heyndrickxia sporothermodurans]MBL5779257.1 MarR family transcriptional regulator [Heyndrickxia sporothermodurans]MBL5782942.1 MarR family transcriptional regulator [Heyndrickxia sporothermodurans]
MNQLSLEILRAFDHVQQNARKIFQKTASDHNLSIPQLVLLTKLAPQIEMTQKELGKETQLPKSTLSQAVDGLVLAGLIHRHPVEDNRREMQLILSEKGKEFFDTIWFQKGSIHHAFECALRTFTEKQSEDFLAALRQIALFLEKEITEQGECSNG